MPHDELCGQDDGFLLNFLVCQQAEQKTRSSRSLLPHWLANRRQIGDGGHGMIIDPNHGNIPRNHQSGSTDSSDRTDRNLIGVRIDGRWWTLNAE